MVSSIKATAVFVLFVLIIVFIRLVIPEISYARSSIDNAEYLVRNLPDKLEAANMLARLRRRMEKLISHLKQAQDNYPDYHPYVDQLVQRMRTVIISESGEDSIYTSYSVNKGDEIVFCIRNKKTNRIHPINLLMYVAIHELSHVACPEFGHTELFKRIFAFFATEATKINLYNKIPFETTPINYCGLLITDSVI